MSMLLKFFDFFPYSDCEGYISKQNEKRKKKRQIFIYGRKWKDKRNYHLYSYMCETL